MGVRCFSHGAAVQALTHEYPRVIPRMGVDDGINAARHLLGMCEFDAAACSEGLKALRSYRKEWDEERGVWRDKPRHDWASHRRGCFHGEPLSAI